MRTKQQWFDTLKSWVPSWFFETQEFNVAVFFAVARVLEVQDADDQNNLDQTFIDTATGEYLALHGNERNVDRLPGEFDPQYRVRIKNKSLVSNVDKPKLLSIVNQLLIKGQASIKEDWEGGIYFGRDCFFNRGQVVIEEPIEPAFTIVVDKQIHDPYSFFNRENFFDRDDYMGTTQSSSYVFQLILNAVNDNKAFGVVYRIIERLQ